MNYILLYKITLEIKGTTGDPLADYGNNVAIVGTYIPVSQAALSIDESGQVVVYQKTQSRTQQERYIFLKNLMLNIAGELNKQPSEAFAIKNHIEELKFWAELGAAEAVVAKLQSMESSTIFSNSMKERPSSFAFVLHFENERLT